MKTILFTILIISASFFYSSSAEARDLSYLRSIKINHPSCKGRAQLGVAHDYFVELANDLLGVHDYNEMVRHYRRKRWKEFDKKFAEFRGLYGSSPLQEAAAYLNVQALFEKAADEVGPPNLKNVDKKFREVLLRYPKSSMVPVLYTTAGNFWLQRKMYAKSLSLYEQVRSQFPFHSASCVILMGVAESRFQLEEFDRAKPTFNLVIQKCNNQRLQLGAMIRLADMRWAKKRENSEQLYQKALDKDVNRFNRFYPHALHNLGEIKYQKGQYKSARFYFNEYLNNSPRQAECVPYALKRKADIAFKLKTNNKKVVGLFMVARNRAPASDIGRFSYLRGLMIEFPDVNPAEYGRRIRVIDEEVDKIENKELRRQGYVEKGLVLMDAGEIDSIDYLARLYERKEFQFNPKGEVGKFIRAKLIDFLSAEADRSSQSEDAKKKTSGDKTSEDKTLLAVEKVFPIWLKGHREVPEARTAFTEAVLRRFESSLKGEDKADAFKRLKQWSQSQLWNPKGISREARDKFNTVLFQTLWSSKKQADLALLYSKNQKLLNPLVRGSYSILWLATSLALQDDRQIRKLAKSLATLRSPASMDKKVSSPVRDYSLLVVGRVYRRLNKMREADIVFKKVKKPPFLEMALRERLVMYRASGQYSAGFKTGLQLYGRIDKKEKLALLKELKELVEKGKLWNKANQLVRLVERSPASEKQRAPFYHLAGHAYYTRSQCRQATGMFEKALVLDSGFRSSPEAHFKLGKCLLVMRRPAQAKKVWEDLAKMKDSFWSPLARNELKILSQ